VGFRRATETARELQRLNALWLEEPLCRYDFDGLAELNRLVDLPIAGGENNHGVHEYRWMLERGVFDILQPDVMVADGVTGFRQIAGLASVFNKRIIPHHGGGTWGRLPNSTRSPAGRTHPGSSFCTTRRSPHIPMASPSWKTRRWWTRKGMCTCRRAGIGCRHQKRTDRGRMSDTAVMAVQSDPSCGSTRREWLTGVSAAISASSTAPAQTGGEVKRPNIVLIISDQAPCTSARGRPSPGTRCHLPI